MKMTLRISETERETEAAKMIGIILSKPVTKRKFYDYALLEDMLKQVKYFQERNFTIQELNLISKYLVPAYFKQGQIVADFIGSKKYANQFYIILLGKVSIQVYLQNNPTAKSSAMPNDSFREVARLEMGASFGDLSTIVGQRSARIVAVQNSYFAILPNEPFEQILRRKEEKRTLKVVNFLQDTAYFNMCNIRNIYLVQHYFHKKCCIKGQIVCNIGDKANTLYLIKNGEFEIKMVAYKSSETYKEMLRRRNETEFKAKQGAKKLGRMLKIRGGGETKISEIFSAFPNINSKTPREEIMEVSVKRIAKGELFGHDDIMMERDKYTATLRCISTQAELFAISKDNFNKWVVKLPGVNQYLRREISLEKHRATEYVELCQKLNKDKRVTKEYKIDRSESVSNTLEDLDIQERNDEEGRILGESKNLNIGPPIQSFCEPFKTFDFQSKSSSQRNSPRTFRPLYKRSSSHLKGRQLKTIDLTKERDNNFHTHVPPSKNVLVQNVEECEENFPALSLKYIGGRSKKNIDAKKLVSIQNIGNELLKGRKNVRNYGSHVHQGSINIDNLQHILKGVMRSTQSTPLSRKELTSHKSTYIGTKRSDTTYKKRGEGKTKTTTNLENYPDNISATLISPYKDQTGIAEVAEEELTYGEKIEEDENINMNININRNMNINMNSYEIRSLDPNLPEEEKYRMLVEEYNLITNLIEINKKLSNTNNNLEIKPSERERTTEKQPTSISRMESSTGNIPDKIFMKTLREREVLGGGFKQLSQRELKSPTRYQLYALKDGKTRKFRNIVTFGLTAQYYSPHKTHTNILKKTIPRTNRNYRYTSLSKDQQPFILHNSKNIPIIFDPQRLFHIK